MTGLNLNQDQAEKISLRNSIRSDDSELIALCNEFNALYGEWLDAMKDPADEPRDEVYRRNEPRNKEILDAIWDLPPQTPAGWVALAKSIVLFEPGILDGSAYEGDLPFELVATLVRGLVAAGKAAGN
jgi:hypothetical protein